MYKQRGPLRIFLKRILGLVKKLLLLLRRMMLVSLLFRLFLWNNMWRIGDVWYMYNMALRGWQMVHHRFLTQGTWYCCGVSMVCYLLKMKMVKWGSIRNGRRKKHVCILYFPSIFFLHNILAVSWSHSIIQVKSQEYFACKIT